MCSQSVSASLIRRTCFAGDPMEELVKEADEIVNEEMKERQRKREEDAKAVESTDGKMEEIKEEGEPEVSSA